MTMKTFRRSRDAILSAIPLGSREEREFSSRTGSIIGYNPGMVWDGIWRTRLDRMDRAAAVSAVSDRMVNLNRSAERNTAFAPYAADEIGELADYLTERNALGSSEAAGGPSGSLTFSGDVSGTPEAINAENKAFWSDRLGQSRTKDSEIGRAHV